MSRSTLPNRRASITANVAWTSPADVDTKLIATFGFDNDSHVREVFCAGFRRESDMCALMNDACILLSRLLQYGERLEDLALSMSENRREGERDGPPASMMGAIMRTAVEVERAVQSGDLAVPPPRSNKEEPPDVPA